MTYRAMTDFGADPLRGLGAVRVRRRRGRRIAGLGAPPPMDDAMIAYLTKYVISIGGCTPAVKASIDAQPCLSPQQVQWYQRCLSGSPTPAGLNDLEWAAGCMSLANCGIGTKAGCAADTPPIASLPACLTDAQYTEVGPIIEYCRNTPNFDGTNKPMNAICWTASRYADFYSKMLGITHCAAPTTTTTTAPESTPTMLPTEEPGPVVVNGGVAPPTEEGMSDTTKYALYGAGALAILGIGWLMFRK